MAERWKSSALFYSAPLRAVLQRRYKRGNVAELRFASAGMRQLSRPSCVDPLNAREYHKFPRWSERRVRARAGDPLLVRTIRDAHRAQIKCQKFISNVLRERDILDSSRVTRWGPLKKSILGMGKVQKSVIQISSKRRSLATSEREARSKVSKRRRGARKSKH